MTIIGAATPAPPSGAWAQALAACLRHSQIWTSF
jgi:hypothetical protein